MALDPARASAQVTREVAAKLATLARELEAAGHAAEPVAAFLTRCLYCMFAEDVGLLPKADDGQGAFLALLKRHRDQPDTLRQMLRVLWMDMDRGGFSAALTRDVLHFNGKLFKGHAAADYVLPLQRQHIDGLLDAATSNWREVEPAIFGTLLERALDPDERHALGAHYTPRAYVERLVLPTVVEPLRADWADAQAAALILAQEATQLEANPPKVETRADFPAQDRHRAAVRAKWDEARAQVKGFHHQLCTVRVLDPACGSGNFLYVTLEHLKRLEGEVLEQLHALGDAQASLLETVTPQQLLGIEINERAAALAELVLWIGYLQWHIRTFGDTSVAEPVIHDYGNIEHRDAVLAYDGQEPMLDAAGQLVTRWDGKTFKLHPATGERVPDEKAVVPQWRYLNPRAAERPKADFIVGNPPFIGNKRMREALGDGYVEALRASVETVPDTADFVMYWWNHAATLVRHDQALRFGLITTNSLTMIFNRKVIEAHRGADPALHLAFAIPDHPWVDSADGAAVRIAMSVGRRDQAVGRLLRETGEEEIGFGEQSVQFYEREGIIHSDLRAGANIAGVVRLQANIGLSFMGMIPLGAGFWVDLPTARLLGLGTVAGLDAHVRRYLNGKDLMANARGVLALDFFGMPEDEVRRKFPAAYQWILDRVKPVRDKDNRPARRLRWWTFAEAVPKFRLASCGLLRYIGTAETAKHRVFSFIDTDVLPDQKVRCVAMSDALHLGVLSSECHVQWAHASGGRLGVGNDPVYNNTRCFEPFPFPSDDTGLVPALAARIRDLAEQLDAHRKTQQAAHPELTLTGMYNVLEKLRRAEPLTAKDKLIHSQGLVSVLKSLHDDLDAAVLQAYGWSDLQAALADHAQAEARAAAVETLLERLVALNAKRAAEEAAGHVRWLRPDFQQRGVAVQGRIDAEVESEEPVAVEAAPAAAVPKRPWPAGLPEQIKAVAEILSGSPRALSLADLEQRFTARGRWRDRLPTIVDTLEALGRARRAAGADARWQSA